MTTAHEPQMCTGSFLTGVRVVELADELGEYCGKVLAGLGADVIKVEPPSGERTRRIGPFLDDIEDPNRSLHFWHYNFGKRSIVLDLDQADGQERFQRLVSTADVVIDTRHRNHLSSRGCGHEQLARANPGLITVRISPFGDTGPWADYVAGDLVQLALGGMMMNCGYDADLRGEYDTTPVAPQMWHAYHIAGEVTAVQIVAALCYRNVTGEGQHISTSVHEAVSANTEQDTPDWIYTRQPHVRRTCMHSVAQTEERPQDAAKRAAVDPAIMRTKDGRWILPYTSYIQLQGSVSGGGGDAVDRLLAVVRHFGGDDEFIGSRLLDATRRDSAEFLSELTAMLVRFIGRLDFDDDVWMVAQQHGLAWAELRRPEENLDDEHWRLRETFVDVDHPRGVRTTEVRAKWLAPGLPWRSGPAAPELGAHSAEIGREIESAPDRVERSAAHVGEARRVPVQSKLGMPFALSGIRVVDLSWALASAGGGRFLTALGAEVIKIEHESRIDGMRRAYGRVPDGGRAERDAARRPLAPGPSSSLNRSGAFMETNAGKLSVSINLKTARGRGLLARLLERADIVVEGFSPGTFERMGFGYEQLKALKPDLIYVQQSGTGQAGCHGRLRTFGPSAQALSGLSEMSGLPEPHSPAGIGYSYLDWFGAYQIALAMVAALYRRDVTGEGCWIDSSQVECGLYLTGSAVLDFTANGRRWSRRGNRSIDASAAPHGAYRGAGHDRWIAITAFTDAHWAALAGVLGPEWLGDPRFATSEGRVANEDVLDALLADAIRGRDVFELMHQLQSAGVPAGACQTAEDRCERDLQLAHLGWMTELRQSEIGTWPVRTIPVHMSATPPYIGGLHDRHGPSYGEDTDAVLGELLGLGADDLAELRRDGVI